MSLLYLLIYFLNEGKVFGFDPESNIPELNERNIFDEIKRLKAQAGYDICTGNAECLQSFAQEVFWIGYAEKPNYKKL